MSQIGLETAEAQAAKLMNRLRIDLGRFTAELQKEIVSMRYVLSSDPAAFSRSITPSQRDSIAKLLSQNDELFMQLRGATESNSAHFTERYAAQLKQRLTQKEALMLEAELKFQQFKMQQMDKQLVTQTDILNEARMRQAHADALKSGGMVTEQFSRVTVQDLVTTRTKAAGSKTLGKYMERLYNDYGTAYRAAYRQALAGNMTEKDIIDRMQRVTGITEGRARLLVRTEANAIFNDQIAQQIMDNPLIAGYIFRATLDRRTSDVCSELDGHYFDKEDLEPGVNFPPMHPNCRSTVETVMTYDMKAEKQRIARPDDSNNWVKMPGGTTYGDFKAKAAEAQRLREMGQEDLIPDRVEEM